MSVALSVGKFEVEGTRLNTSLSREEIESSFREGLIGALEKMDVLSLHETRSRMATLQGYFLAVNEGSRWRRFFSLSWNELFRGDTKEDAKVEAGAILTDNSGVKSFRVAASQNDLVDLFEKKSNADILRAVLAKAGKKLAKEVATHLRKS